MQYWLQRALSWPIRFVARVTGYWEPSLSMDFEKGTYTDARIWPFHRDVMEILVLTGNAKLTPNGLLINGEGGTASVKHYTTRNWPEGELKKRTE